MAITLDDLQPKKFIVKLRGDLELESKPLQLSDALLLTRVGQIFLDPSKATKQQIKEAEIDFYDVLGNLMPDLKDKQIGAADSMEIIGQLMDTIVPSDNKELSAKGVKLNKDPKA